MKAVARAALLGMAAAAGLFAIRPCKAAQQALPINSFPTQLVGKWGFVTASGNYCDPLSHCAPGGGGSISFTFRADGRTEYRIFESALVEGCGQIQTMTVKTGRSRVSGPNLVFTPTAGTYKSVNGCRPDLTGTWQYGPGDLKPTSVRWQLAGETLRLEDPANEASGTYRRQPLGGAN